MTLAIWWLAGVSVGILILRVMCAPSKKGPHV